MARWAAWWSFGSEVPGGLGVTLNIVWMLHFGPRLIATKRKVAAVCRLVERIFQTKPARPRAPCTQPPLSTDKDV